MTAAEVTRFLDLTERLFGLRFDDRLDSMATLAERRAAAHHEPVARYLDRVESGDRKELRELITELTVGETYFFRHAEQFHAFADVALVQRIAARGRIRVLSAGCSSGEEAYTMAMLVRERVADPNAVSIHAIDLNQSSLDRAARGRYSRWALRAIPPELEQRWFTQEGRDVILSPDLRASVTFERRNLNDANEAFWAPGSWDIVFCRNVLMYFSPERSRAAIAQIANSLAPGGYFFLGHAETLRDRAELELCNTHGTFYYQRNTPPVTPRPIVITAPELSLGTDWFAEIQAATSKINELVDGALAVPPAPVESTAEIRELFEQERFVEVLDRLAASPDDDPALLLLRALALTHAGRIDDAELASTELLAIEPRNAGAYYVLALCRASANDPKTAMAHARRAGDLEPTFAMARVQLGLVARRAGEREVAHRELTRAIELLEHERPDRLALFGGGFGRQALIALCRSELARGPR